MTAALVMFSISALLRLPLHGLDVEAEHLTWEKRGEVVGTIAPALRLGPATHGRATHYGSSFNGRPLGCGGTYWSSDPSIAAVGPARYSQWPCGTELRITGPAGSAIVQRRDACPGCGPNLIDLSEAANRPVCGVPEHTCVVVIEEVLR